MKSGQPTPLLIHGWTVFAHPLFLAQVLVQQVEAIKQKDPVGYKAKTACKRLAAIAKLAFDVISQDPTRTEYRQGGTLGAGHKHWLHAKFSCTGCFLLSRPQPSNCVRVGQRRAHPARL
jgi:toxin YhaV